MAPPVLHRVIWGSQTPPTPAHASLLSIRPAILHAHQRRHVKGADYPAVIPSTPASEVRGTLVEGLTDGDIWRLDIFEGDEYERQNVAVRVLESKGRAGDAEHGDVEGEEVQAQTYIWIAGEQRLETDEWDFEHFVKEKMSRWVGREAADGGFQGRASINGRPYAACGTLTDRVQMLMTLLRRFRIPRVHEVRMGRFRDSLRVVGRRRRRYLGAPSEHLHSYLDSCPTTSCCAHPLLRQTSHLRH